MNAKLARQYFDRADALLREGKGEDALLLLDTLDEAFPNQQNVLFARARTLVDLERNVEALALCDAIIDRFDSARARSLKQSILSPREVVESNPKRGMPRVATLAILVIVGGAVIAAAWNYIQQKEAANSTFAAPTHTEFDALVSQRAKSKRDRYQAQAKLDAERRPELLIRAKAPTTDPGRVHPREEWILLATNGIPKWKPGIYEQVPSINAPERTLDVFIPMAYQERPEDFFPIVYVQMPLPNSSFIGLAPWAASREVILVVINSSYNGKWEQTHWQNNHAAQDHAIQTVIRTLRADKRLGFAVGMSGGGTASRRMATRYPDYFAGVVMMGISGRGDGEIPKAMRIGIIHGDREPNNPSIAQAIPRLRKRGHEVREVIVPGEHVMGPREVRIQMLDWMLSESRRELGLPHPMHEVPPPPAP